MLGDKSKTLRVNLFDVVPPSRLVICRFDFLVQTCLTQVLHDDVFALDSVKVVDHVVGGAVLAVREALRFLKLGVADSAAPSDEAGRDVDVTLELVSILVEFFDEVQGSHIVRAIPDFNVCEV